MTLLRQKGPDLTARQNTIKDKRNEAALGLGIKLLGRRNDVSTVHSHGDKANFDRVK